MIHSFVIIRYFSLVPVSLLTRNVIVYLWVTFLAETSKDLEIILIIIVLSLTNRLSRTSAWKTIRKTQYDNYEELYFP